METGQVEGSFTLILKHYKAHFPPVVKYRLFTFQYNLMQLYADCGVNDLLH